MFRLFSNHYLTKKIITGVLLVIFSVGVSLAPLNKQGEVQTAEALFGAGDTVFVIGGTGTIQQTISAGANSIMAGLQSAFNIKEFVLDGLAHHLARMVLKSMTQSILNWINSGFQGKPAFVTDLKQHLLDQVDRAIGEYIYEDPALNFLCSPFQLDVKIALATSYQETAHDNLTEAQCTLSEVTDNIEGFLNGDFSQGGWDSWIELTQNPGNTPTGAYRAANDEMNTRIVNEQGQTLTELDWGNGFLSFKVCEDGGNAGNCDITTPGSVIANQINKSLGAPQDSLITADEINEIISALFAQLAQKALTGVYGLLGLGGSSYSDNSYGSSGSSSYLDAITEVEDSGIASPFERFITAGEEYILIQRDIVDMIDEVEAEIDANLERHTGCFSYELPDELVSQRNTARAEIILASNSVTSLVELENNYNSSTDPEEQIELVNTLQAMQTNDQLYNEADVSLATTDRDVLLPNTISAVNSEISAALNPCREH